MSSIHACDEVRPVIPMNSLNGIYGRFRDELNAAAARVIESGWTVLGPEVEAFEEAWAAQLGARYCVGVASGSDALQLALRALDVGPGDEVLTVANAGGYSTLAILAVGARPVFLEVHPDTLLLDETAIGGAITPRTKALVVTHLYGRMAPMPAVLAPCRAAGIAVIEDAAQAHGAHWNGRQAGAWADIGCFSFYPTKNLGALGDGGAVCSDDAGLAARVRQLRQYGWQPKYQVQIPGGINSRLDEIQAAFLRVLLGGLSEFNQARREISLRYSDVLAGISGDVHPGRPVEAVDAAHLFVTCHPRRDVLRSALMARGIQTDIHYPVPDHLQPGFIARVEALGLPPMAAAGALPVSEAACAKVISLPCYPGLDATQVQRVCTALAEVW